MSQLNEHYQFTVMYCFVEMVDGLLLSFFFIVVNGQCLQAKMFIYNIYLYIFLVFREMCRSFTSKTGLHFYKSLFIILAAIFSLIRMEV